MTSAPALGTSAIGDAMSWLQSTLMGSVSISIAIIAMAGVGIIMLAGRVDIRRAAQVVFGCFLIFGAASIAQGLQSAITGSPDAAGAAPEVDQPYYPQVSQQNSTAPAAYDPYAGAALSPTR